MVLTSVQAGKSRPGPDFRGPGSGPKVANSYRRPIVKWPFFGPWRPGALRGLLAGPEEIRYWLIVLMIRMMQISPMILMNLIILMILMILSCLLGPLVQAVKSGLGPDFRGPGSGPKVANSY